MRTGNKLTPLAIRNAIAPGLYGDGHGLYLQVSVYGTKAWLYRFMRDGQARKMGLGALHTVSLAEARKRAAAARLQVHDDIDPIEDRNAARAAKRVSTAKAISFKECADAYIEANEAGWKNEKHRQQWRSTFEETKRGKRKYPALTAAINDLPVGAIDTGLVLKVLEPIWKTKTETASRVRGRIETVLNWAAVREYRGGENPARWRGHLENVLPPPTKVKKVTHHNAVPYAEIPAFMADLRARQGISARALEFTVLNATRTGETIGARWSEFDLTAKMWVIPPERMKASREHRVPLSDRVVEILNGLPQEGEFLFPGAKSDRPLSNMAMLELMRGMRGQGATVHGLRSSFKDWASETTAYPNELSEIALAHVVSDKTEAAYRRADMIEKRRRLMADWATYCGSALAAKGSKVVAIRKKA